jgi:hypothetical protein
MTATHLSGVYLGGQTRHVVQSLKGRRGNFRSLWNCANVYYSARKSSPRGPSNTVLPPLVPTEKMDEDNTTIKTGDDDEEIVASGSVPFTFTPVVAVSFRGSFVVRSTPRPSSRSRMFRVERWWRKRPRRGLRTSRRGSLEQSLTCVPSGVRNPSIAWIRAPWLRDRHTQRMW